MDVVKNFILYDKSFLIFTKFCHVSTYVKYFYTVRNGLILMSQKSLFLSTSCTQKCRKTKRLKFEKQMYLYLKCMLFLKVSQHALILETQLFLKVCRHMVIFEKTCYSNMIWDVLIFETSLNCLIGSHFIHLLN